MTEDRTIPYVGSGDADRTWFRTADTPCGLTTDTGTKGHFLAGPEQTGGRFSAYRWDMTAASGGPDPHFHRTYDETFYVLTGRVRLYDGNRWFDAKEGDMLHVPAGGIHAFTNDSGQDASMLMLITPGVDRGAYFTELAALRQDGARASSGSAWESLHARHDNVMIQN